MARLKIKQLFSNMSYDGYNHLTISGSVNVVSSPTVSGSLSIENIDTFGDSGSFYTVDLGDY
jgi:hypothetical protein